MSGHIFLSYSSKDFEAKNFVKKTLQNAGANVWSSDNIQPGTPDWQKAIENAINTASIIIVLLSPNAKESNWVRLEIEYARINLKPIFPIMVKGNSRNAIPIPLVLSQYTKLAELNELIKDLKSGGWIEVSPQDVSLITSGEIITHSFVEKEPQYRYLSSLEPIHFIGRPIFDCFVNAKVDCFLTLAFGQGIIFTNSQLYDSVGFITITSDLIDIYKESDIQHKLPLKFAYFNYDNQNFADTFHIGSQIFNGQYNLSAWPSLNHDLERRRKWAGELALRKPIYDEYISDAFGRDLISDLNKIIIYG